MRLPKDVDVLRRASSNDPRWYVPLIEEWDDANGRSLRCPDCKATVPITIVPHLRKRHPVTWAKYVRIFREMHDEGHSFKKIYEHFGRRFTWLVIARELTDHDGKLPEIDQRKITLPKIELQSNTFWSFSKRGSWGVHDAKYRGNWAPEVPRNIIERYSKRGDVVLDPFVGGGTTVLEAMACGRRSIGSDISTRAVRLAEYKVAKLGEALRKRRRKVPENRIFKADARNLPLPDESVDLVCAHPPYLDIIAYTHNEPGDLSRIADPARFAQELGKAAAETHRVLKVAGYCALLIGDVRRDGHLIPLGFLAMRAFLGAFDLRDIVVKEQPRSGMSYFWAKRAPGRTFFYQLAHEYLFILQKPAPGNPLERGDLAPYLHRL